MKPVQRFEEGYLFEDIWSPQLVRFIIAKYTEKWVCDDIDDLVENFLDYHCVKGSKAEAALWSVSNLPSTQKSDGIFDRNLFTTPFVPLSKMIENILHMDMMNGKCSLWTRIFKIDMEVFHFSVSSSIITTK